MRLLVGPMPNRRRDHAILVRHPKSNGRLYCSCEKGDGRVLILMDDLHFSTARTTRRLMAISPTANSK